MNGWITTINTISTTSFRILVSVLVASLGMIMILVAILFFGWSPTPAQITVLTGLAAVALKREGFDVTQFGTKRVTHAEYVAAKQGPSPVTVEAPSKVEVTAPDGDTAPTVTVAPVAVTRDD